MSLKILSEGTDMVYRHELSAGIEFLPLHASLAKPTWRRCKQV